MALPYDDIEEISPGVFRWASIDAASVSSKAIYFDMDGTIADLYGVDGWLDRLEAQDPGPYREAEPLIDPELLWDFCATAAGTGFRIGIISWLSKECSRDYALEIIEAKLDWCRAVLPVFDEVVICPYGTPKAEVAEISENAILIDDEEGNRVEWENAGANRVAYSAEDLPVTLTLLQNMLEIEDGGAF